MAATTLSELSIVIRAHASEISEEITHALHKAEHGTRAAATALGVAIGAGITVAAAGIAEAFHHGVEQIEELRIAAEKLGTSVSGLSEMKFAADMAGTSFEALQTAIGKMEQNLATGKANDALGHLKLDAAEIRALAPEKQFAEIAEALRQVGDQDAKMALGRKIFGKGFMEIIPLINKTEEQLKELRDISEVLGTTIDDRVVGAVHNFHEATKLLGQAWDGFARQLAGQLAPILQGLDQQFIGMVRGMGGMQQVAANVAGALQTWVAIILNAAWGVDQLVTLLTAFGSEVAAVQLKFAAWAAELAGPVIQKVGALSMRLGQLSKDFELNFKNIVATVIAGLNLSINSLLSQATDAFNKIKAMAFGAYNSFATATGGKTAGFTVDSAPQVALPEVDVNSEMSDSLLNAGAAAQSAGFLLPELSKGLDDAADSANEAGAALEKNLGKDAPWGVQFEANVAAQRRVIGQLPEAVDKSLLDVTEGADKAAKKHKELIGKVVKETDHAMEQMQATNREAVTDLVTAWATGTGKMSDIIKQWAQQTIKTMVSTLLFGTGTGGRFAGAFGALGGGGGSLLGSVVGGLFGVGGGFGGAGFAGAAQAGIGALGGAFAGGGEMTAGRSYLVGERGPELVVPKQAGTVIPRNRSGWSGGKKDGSTEATIVNQTFQVGVSKIELAAILDTLEDRTTAGVVAAYERGGSTRRRLRA